MREIERLFEAAFELLRIRGASARLHIEKVGDDWTVAGNGASVTLPSLAEALAAFLRTEATALQGPLDEARAKAQALASAVARAQKLVEEVTARGEQVDTTLGPAVIR